MELFQADKPYPVHETPFEHVIVDNFLPAATFAALAQTFPECAPATGPTGFTIHPGDPDFDTLMRTHAGWRELWLSCDSPAFVAMVLRQFESVFRREALCDLERVHHVRYIESRADKESSRIAEVEHPSEAFFVRFDLMQGRVGYARVPHLDHRRRAATMLLYFSDPNECGMSGGELVLHDAAGSRTVVEPRANRAVMFACGNRSWHSVSPITAQRSPRNFVQVTVSSSLDIWQPLPRSPGERLREAGRRAVGRAWAIVGSRRG